MPKEEIILRITGGNMKGEEFVFDEKGLCLIGRSSDCALQIPKEKDMRISRRHCLLILEPPNIRIRDLGSRNGTLVNGELLQPGQILDNPHQMTPSDKILKDGDIVSLGESVLKVEIPSERSAAPMIPQTKPHVKSTAQPATKVIKLSKPLPTPMQTGTMIPKSQPVDTGFFAPPPSNVNTSSSAIALTEVIPRENMPQISKPLSSSYSTHPRIPLPTLKRPEVRISPSSVDPGPLAPPPRPKLQNNGSMTMLGKVAPGTLAPPTPPKPVEPQKPVVLVGKIVSPTPPTPPKPVEPQKPVVLVGKIVSPTPQAPSPQPVEPPQADTEGNNADNGTQTADEPRKVIAKVSGTGLTYDKTKIMQPRKKDGDFSILPEDGRPKVLKAKIIPPGTVQEKQPRKLDSHMKTVVMSTNDFTDITSDLVQQPTAPDDDTKPKKRVTTFKIKGPS